MTVDQQPRPSRRGLLAFGAGTAAVVATGCGAATSRAATGTTPAAVDVFGAEQAGITRPALPQAQLISQVYDVHSAPGPLLRRLGELVVALTGRPLDGVEEPEDLTVTVGVGPRLVRTVGAGLPGAEELPRYRGEEIAADHRGGDLWVQICGTNPLVTGMAAAEIQHALGGDVRLRWSQRGWRGDYQRTPDGHQAGRNLQGFQDGIVNPRSADELRDGVWLAGLSAVAGGTVAVIRRFRIDLGAWRDMGVPAQEAAVGRTKTGSAPLSGGRNVDLGAKTPDGRYKIASDAHVRRANPLDTGVPTMLRRSYSVDDPEPGLLFISFQNALRTFTATMQRLSESDRMLDVATTTATGSFLVLPGVTKSRPLGSTLFT